MSSVTNTNPSETNSPESEWHLELAEYLMPECLPASGDQVLSALIGRRCPSRLLWHLSSLPQSRRYTSVNEVITAAQGAPGN